MNLRLTLACTLAITVGGCGKKPDSTSSGQTPAAVNAEAARAQQGADAPNPNALPPATAVDTGDPAAALSALTQALRKYSAERQRVPQSLNEVISAGYLTAMPPAPPGKKYAINPKRLEVILVNQ